LGGRLARALLSAPNKKQKEKARCFLLSAPTPAIVWPVGGGPQSVVVKSIGILEIGRRSRCSGPQH
jgi:hypothetical protein